MLQRHQSSLTYLYLSPDEQTEVDLLVMLHGYGSNEKDLMQLAPMLDENMCFITPRAPLALAPEMYGWFPVEFTSEGITVDEKEAQTALNRLLDFLHTLRRTHNPPESRIWLLGFSQGAVMSYLAAFAEPDLFHGVIALSGQFPASSAEMPADPERFRSIPFLVVHGLYDDVLPVSNGRKCRLWLEKHVDSLTYREFAMGHEINNETLLLLKDWLHSGHRQA